VIGSFTRNPDRKPGELPWDTWTAGC